MYELSLSPAVPGHAISPESVELYVSDTNEKGSYHKLEATVSIDDASGRIIVKASQAILTRYAKVHCILDTRDKNLKAAQARFTNLATGILRIGYYAQKTDAYYGYDKQGNRVSSSITKGEAGLGLSATLENALYRYWDNSDRVKLVEKTTTEQDGLPVTSTWAYTYDALGNLAEKGDTFVQNGVAIDFLSDSGHYVRYEYDLWNRLVAVWKGEAGTASATQAATYVYDPTGLRIRKISTSATTEYVYGLDGNVLRETRDETVGDDVAIDYVYALGKLVGWTETIAGASVKYWAATDHLGSVTAATDSSGKIAMLRDYSAFGDSKDAVLETEAGPRYTGKDYDEDAELYYFNARWYDPELGRFTTEDPIKDGMNWYTYVGNRPLVYTDPTGLQGRDRGASTPTGDRGRPDGRRPEVKKESTPQGVIGNPVKQVDPIGLPDDNKEATAGASAPSVSAIVDSGATLSSATGEMLIISGKHAVSEASEIKAISSPGYFHPESRPAASNSLKAAGDLRYSGESRIKLGTMGPIVSFMLSMVVPVMKAEQMDSFNPVLKGIGMYTFSSVFAVAGTSIGTGIGSLVTGGTLGVASPWIPALGLAGGMAGAEIGRSTGESFYDLIGWGDY